MAENKIEIDIDLAIKTALKGIDELNKKFDGFADNTGKTSKRAAGAWEVFQGVIASRIVEKALGFAFDAAKKLFEIFIIDGIRAASEQEEALNAMNVALISTGNYSSEASLGMVEFADQMQRTTKYSDDQILSNAALIQSMAKLTGDGLKKATAAAIELAATYQLDLETASRMIGKASEGNVVAFQKLGINIETSNDKAITFANTLKMLAGSNGTAEAQAKTFSGAMAILRNSFEDIQEETGKIVTQNPALITAINFLSKGFQELSGFVKGNKTALTNFVTDGVLFAVTSLNVLAGAFSAMAPVFNYLRGTLEAMTAIVTISLREMGKISKETADEMETSFKKLKNIDISEILAKSQIAIGEYTAKFKEAIKDQTSADEEKTRREQAESDKRAAQRKIEIDKKKNWEFQAMFEVKKFEDKTSQEKIQGQQTTFSTMATLMKSNNMTLFRIGQAAAIANATIDGISAVMNALESFPYPYNIVVGAIVGGIAASNIAQIAGANPSFAQGGIVPGSSFTGDRVAANVNSGEMILTMTDQLDLLKQIRNGQSGGGQTVVVQGNVYADDDVQVDRLMARIKDRLEFGNGSLSPVV